MADKKERKKDDPEQSKRFVEAAKKLAADTSGESFEKAMGVISGKPRRKGG